MTDAAQLRRSTSPQGNYQLLQVTRFNPAYNRFLYAEVGRNWQWTDKLGWSEQEWRAWVCRDELETWVLYEQGTPAGYFELERQAGGDVEIAYFGLLPDYIGRGLGGYLLSECIARAWRIGAARVYVHTCSLDHPGALRNYQVRGLRIYKQACETGQNV
jgi:GNAT superfamily N-acetyltransferase